MAIVIVPDSPIFTNCAFSCIVKRRNHSVYSRIDLQNHMPIKRGLSDIQEVSRGTREAR